MILVPSPDLSSPGLVPVMNPGSFFCAGPGVEYGIDKSSAYVQATGFG